MYINDKSCSSQDLTNEILEFIHFIRTPLASIKIGGHILNEALPLLINSYKSDLQSNEKNGIVTGINKIDKLTSIVNNMLIEANRISEHAKKIEMRITKQKINPEKCND
ncbi:MAG: hypothetical protein WC785_05655 [Tatlockia sp.]|jgi:hypothetical protein